MQHRATLSENGRIVIPAECRRQLGLQPQDEVIIQVINGEARIKSVRQAIQEAQLLLSKTKAKTSMLDDLLEMRRAERDD